jgi:hypothetical protein
MKSRCEVKMERDLSKLKELWQQVLLKVPAEKFDLEEYYYSVLALTEEELVEIEEDSSERKYEIEEKIMSYRYLSFLNGILAGKTCEKLWGSNYYGTACALGWGAVYFAFFDRMKGAELDLYPCLSPDESSLEICLANTKLVNLGAAAEFFNLCADEADWLFSLESYSEYDIAEVCLRFQKFLELGGLTPEEESSMYQF